MTKDEVADLVAAAFADAVLRATGLRGAFRCALSGGSIAPLAFPRMARKPLPWNAVEIFLADERVVPFEHDDSNARAVSDHLLAHVHGVVPRLHRMVTPGVAPEVAARLSAEALCRSAGTPPRLDLVVLGVGPDGHVASLFPGLPGWRRDDAWVLAVHDAPKPPPDRLSLGLPTLAHAREIWFVAFGAEKAPAIRAGRFDPESTLPVAVVARSGPAVRWFLDDAASGS